MKNVKGAWMPKVEQYEEYPGAGSYDGYYSLGYFAGISIESSNVILDLNGYSVSMSVGFYLQQRFFSCIALTNKPFMDGKGPFLDGIGNNNIRLISDQAHIKNNVIQNGIIGLSSHHGIYGLNVNTTTLTNLHIKDFETHG